MSFRRVNKSKKVPNVKLRPAAPTARKELRTPESTWTHSSGLDSDEETSHADLCPRPFRGFVLCATGINDKTSLFKLALELGAQSVSDLTDRVTHLIAEETGSPKYRCALENRIPIMHPSWIIESHKVWLRGDDVDVGLSVKEHRLSPFSGVVLCQSDIEDVERRMKISRELTKAGGMYVKQIVRPVKVTHLLCANTMEGESEKVRYAQKFNAVGEARIHIVWEDWFWDSLRFGGRFDEEAYLVSKPRPPPRILPEDTTPPPPSSTIPDGTGLSSEIQNAEASAARGKASTNLNEEEEEIASVKRVPAVTLHLWESILKPRGFEVQNGRLIRSPSKSQSVLQPRHRSTSPTRTAASRALTRRGTLKVGEVNGEAERPGPISALSTFRRAQSFIPAAKDASTPVGGVRQPFQRVPTASRTPSFLQRSVGSIRAAGGIPSDVPIASTSAVAGPSRDASVAPDDPTISTTEISETGKVLFNSLRFRALGEARCASVKSAIEECGGTWIGADDDSDADIIVVRLVSGSNIFRREIDEKERAKYRTECWLERCIFEERVCAPEEHVAFTPLNAQAPIPGAEEIILSFSGLDHAEACWIRRLLRGIGISQVPNFSHRSTHLLCPSGVGAKADKAREWGTPIVDMAWLAAIANTGEIPSTSSHPAVQEVLNLPIDSEPPDPNELYATQPPATAPMPKPDIKGKGKEKATDVTMVDITNGENAAPRSQSLSYYDAAPDEPRPGQAEQMEVFGIPNMLLGTQPIPQPPGTPHHSPQAVPAPSDSGPDHGLATTQPTEEPHSDDGVTIPSRVYEGRVPSSESPSPMRIPGAPTPHDGHAAPSTPVKVTRQVTKVIQTRITNLLGKRPSEEDEEQTPRKLQRHDSRLGKRSKPLQRTRSNMSHSELFSPGIGQSPASAFAAAASPVPPPEPALVPQALDLPADASRTSAQKPKPHSVASGDEGDSISLVEAPGAGDSSLHIAYADPKQYGELDRLKYLLLHEQGGPSQKEAWELELDAEVTLQQLPDVSVVAVSAGGSSRRGRGAGRGRRGKGRGRKGTRA